MMYHISHHVYQIIISHVVYEQLTKIIGITDICVQFYFLFVYMYRAPKDRSGIGSTGPEFGINYFFFRQK